MTGHFFLASPKEIAGFVANFGTSQKLTLAPRSIFLAAYVLLD